MKFWGRVVHRFRSGAVVDELRHFRQTLCQLGRGPDTDGFAILRGRYDHLATSNGSEQGEDDECCFAFHDTGAHIRRARISYPFKVLYRAVIGFSSGIL
jgi:hypothetical protein